MAVLLRQPIASSSKACYACVALQHKFTLQNGQTRAVHASVGTKMQSGLPSRTDSHDDLETLPPIVERKSFLFGFMSRIRDLLFTSKQTDTLERLELFNPSYNPTENSFVIPSALERRLSRLSNQSLLDLLDKGRRKTSRLSPVELWSAILTLHSRQALSTLNARTLMRVYKHTVDGFLKENRPRLKQMRPNSIRRLGSRLLGMHTLVLPYVSAHSTVTWRLYEPAFRALSAIGDYPEASQLWTQMKENGSMQRSTEPQQLSMHNLYGIAIMRWYLRLHNDKVQLRDPAEPHSKTLALLEDMHDAGLKVDFVDSMALRMVKEHGQVRLFEKRLQTAYGLSVDLMPLSPMSFGKEQRYLELTRHVLNTIFVLLKDQNKLSKALAVFESVQYCDRKRFPHVSETIINTQSFRMLLDMAIMNNNKLVGHYLVRTAVEVARQQARSFRDDIVLLASRAGDPHISTKVRRPFVAIDTTFVARIVALHERQLVDPAVRRTIDLLCEYNGWMRHELRVLTQIRNQRPHNRLNENMHAMLAAHIKISQNNVKSLQPVLDNLLHRFASARVHRSISASKRRLDRKEAEERALLAATDTSPSAQESAILPEHREDDQIAADAVSQDAWRLQYA